MKLYDQSSSYGYVGYVDLTGSPPPDVYQGYGLLTLQNVLPAPGVNDGMNLYVQDLASLQSFQYSLYTITVASNSTALKITLAWYDPPNTIFSAKLLLHDLDLIVFSPSEERYVGNFFWDTGALVDEYNPNEQVYIATPAVGSWKVYVVSKVLTESTSQQYSLVVTSNGSVSETGSAVDWSGSFFEQYTYCGTRETLNVGMFDYDGDGWNNGSVSIYSSSSSQAVTFQVINDNPAQPQIYSTRR
jgi:hypothetical protein